MNEPASVRVEPLERNLEALRQDLYKIANKSSQNSMKPLRSVLQEGPGEPAFASGLALGSRVCELVRLYHAIAAMYDASRADGSCTEPGDTSRRAAVSCTEAGGPCYVGPRL